MGIYIEQLMHTEHDPVTSEFQTLKDKINGNIESSRRIMYKQLNPNLESSPVYKDLKLSIPEHHRISYTRIRLGSHRLKIETGRWSRIPRERRVCECGEVQDEIHVLVSCPLLENLRRAHPDLNFDSVVALFSQENVYLLCKYIYDINNQINLINEN